MAYRNQNETRWQAFLRRLKRMIKPEPEPGSPEDPYAYVGAPKKPRPGGRSSAAIADLD